MIISKKNRFFISNYKKTKIVVKDLIGENKCFFCDYNRVLDFHHSNSEKIVLLICPNHHHMIHRCIENNTKLSLKTVIRKIKKIELNAKSYYYFSGASYLRKEDRFEVDRIKHAKKYSFFQGWTEKEKEEYLNTRVKRLSSNFMGGGGKIIEENSSLDTKPQCIICGYDLVLDIHHLNKDSKTVFICPNHHGMIHRNLNDKKGDKFSLKELQKKIKNIENLNKSFYKEVTKKVFNESYKDFTRSILKNPKECSKCGDWFYPKKDRKEICSTCYGFEVDDEHYHECYEKYRQKGETFERYMKRDWGIDLE